MSYIKAIYNGKLINLDEFCINSENRAFRYGDGFFETIVTSAGKSILLPYHIKRINKALFAFQMQSEVEWNEKLLEEYIENLSAYGFNKDVRIRINFWRESRGLYAPLDRSSSYLITIKPRLERKEKILNQAGFYYDMPLVKSRLSAFKSTSSLSYVMAGVEKIKNEWDEVILTDKDGHISDGGTTNVFWIKGAEIFTPSTESGCIEGVMRAYLMDFCQKEKIKVTECLAKETELLSADAVFFSNASGIFPLAKIGNRHFDPQHPLLQKVVSELIV